VNPVLQEAAKSNGSPTPGGKKRFATAGRDSDPRGKEADATTAKENEPSTNSRWA